MTCQNVNIQVVLVRRLMDFSSIKSIRCLFECIFLQPTSILTFEISLPKSIKVICNNLTGNTNSHKI